MPTVIVYRRLLLPISETFIKSQVSAYQRWRAILIGRQFCEELSLDGLDARVLDPVGHNRVSLSIFMIKRMLGRPPHIETLWKEKPSLVHAHFGVDAIEAAPIARALDVPLLVTLHGFDINTLPEWWESGAAGMFMRSYPRQLALLAARKNVHFVAVSNAIRRCAITRGIPENKIKVIHIGVSRSSFTPGDIPITSRGHKVLFVGRLVEKKGCEYLLRALQIVAREVPDVEATIIGDGPLRRSLELLATQLNVKAAFLGARPTAEVNGELDGTRVFCLPSVTAANGDAEGLAIVLLEAQSKGVPVVTSSLPAVEEGIIHGETGFAFAEKDVPELARRLTSVLLDDELAARMAARGPAFISERFDISACTECLERHYDEICGTTSTPGVLLIDPKSELLLN
jgi:glycosyltransferase involved in cell wall biosynthesis